MFNLNRNLKNAFLLFLFFCFMCSSLLGYIGIINPDKKIYQQNINAYLLAEKGVNIKTDMCDLIQNKTIEIALKLKYSIYYQNRGETTIVLKKVDYQPHNLQHEFGRQGLSNSAGWPSGVIYFLTIQWEKERVHFYMLADIDSYKSRRIAEIMLKKFVYNFDDDFSQLLN